MANACDTAKSNISPYFVFGGRSLRRVCVLFCASRIRIATGKRYSNVTETREVEANIQIEKWIFNGFPKI